MMARCSQRIVAQSSWWCAHLGSVLLHFLLLAQVWRASQQHATLHIAWVLAYWFLGTLLGSRQRSKDGSWKAGFTLLTTGALLLVSMAWPRGTIPSFLVPGLWLLPSALVLALVLGTASTRWLGPSRPVGEGTRQLGEALHAIFALILVWSLPEFLMGALGVGLLLPLLLMDVLQRKQRTPGPPPASHSTSLWRWDWWVVYLAGRRQLGLLLLAGCVGILLDTVIGTVLTPVGAAMAHDHTLGLLWYGVEGQLVAVLLGAFLVSLHREALGAAVHVVPVSWDRPARLLLGLALVLVAGSILAFSDHRLLSAWALPFILGGYTLGTLMWGRLVPRVCPPLSAHVQPFPSKPEEAPGFWDAVDAQARKRVDLIAGLLKVLCVPAVGWGIEQWGLSTVFILTGGSLIGLGLLAAGGWALGRRRRHAYLHDALLKKKEGRRGQMHIQPNTSDHANGHRRGERASSLLWYVGILATGALLWWIGGGVPPLAWRQVAQLLSAHATSRPQFPLILAQLAFLLAAWGVLLFLTIRVIAHSWQQRPASPLPHPPAEQHLQESKLKQEAVNVQETPSQHAKPGALSASLLQQVNQVEGESLPHEDRAHDSSRPLPVADVLHPSRPLQPALFGAPLQMTVGRCSDVGARQEPSTTAYLLIEGGSDNNASISQAMGLFALVDHVPCDGPGHATSRLAIEAMRDTVIQACMGTQPPGEKTFATFLGEQVQHVTRIIAQQSQGEEASPAMAAVLVLGSQMVVATMGDTSVYLCRAQDGFYQITGTPGDVHPLLVPDHSSAHSSSHQAGEMQKGGGKGTSRAAKEYSFAVPLAAGDIILFCSDGVWSILHASYLEHLIRSAGPDPSAICSAVLLAVRKSGGTDPVSMIVVHCHHQKKADGS